MHWQTALKLIFVSIVWAKSISPSFTIPQLELLTQHRDIRCYHLNWKIWSWLGTVAISLNHFNHMHLLALYKLENPHKPLNENENGNFWGKFLFSDFHSQTKRNRVRKSFAESYITWGRFITFFMPSFNRKSPSIYSLILWTLSTLNKSVCEDKNNFEKRLRKIIM
jgi:hypothetical protein